MSHRPLRSTLFPYTTLFRSADSSPADGAWAFSDAAHLGTTLCDPASAVDRKSTRLNSSHQIISYAVFCLKKKNSYLLDKSEPIPSALSSFQKLSQVTATTLQ